MTTEPGQPRQFHRTEYKVVVITEKPFLEDVSLHDIHLRMIQGDCAGEIMLVSTTVLNAEETAKELVELVCDPALFGLTTDGKPFEGDEFEDVEEAIADGSAAKAEPEPEAVVGSD